MKHILLCIVTVGVLTASAQQPQATPPSTSPASAPGAPSTATSPPKSGESPAPISLGRQTTPERYTKQVADWTHAFWMWRINFYCFSILGIIASAVVASKWRDSLTTPLSVLAAICTALLALFNSGAKSRAYGRASSTLQVAIDRYEAGKLADDGLLEALEKGVKMADDADQSQ